MALNVLKTKKHQFHESVLFSKISCDITCFKSLIATCFNKRGAILPPKTRSFSTQCLGCKQ